MRLYGQRRLDPRRDDGSMEAYTFLITLYLLTCTGEPQGPGSGGRVPKGASQCSGETMSLGCPQDQHLHVLQVFYGRSSSRCQFEPNQCLWEDRAFHPCTGHRLCEWPVPQKPLLGCGQSTYVTVTFHCLPASAFKDICDRSLHVISKETGYLVSPGYPGNFPILRQPCHVIISLPGQQTGVQFYVYDLDLGQGGSPGGDCENYLEIKLSLVVGDEQAVKICSNNTLKRNQLVTQAEAKLVRVSFHVETTDHTHRGFLVYYKATDQRFSTTPVSIMRSTSHAAVTFITVAATTVIKTVSAISTTLIPESTHIKDETQAVTDTTGEPPQNGSIFSQEKTRNKQPWAAIAGGVIAGIAGILMLVIIGVMIWEKRKKKSARTRMYDDVVFGEKNETGDTGPNSKQDQSRRIQGPPLPASHSIYENVRVNGGVGNDSVCRPDPPCGYGNNRRANGALLLKPGGLPPPPPPDREKVYQNADVKPHGNITGTRLASPGRGGTRSHNYDEVAVDNHLDTRPVPKKRESLGMASSHEEESIYCDVAECDASLPIPRRTTSKLNSQKPGKPPLKPKPKSPAPPKFNAGSKLFRNNPLRKPSLQGEVMPAPVHMVDNEVYESEEYLPS